MGLSWLIAGAQWPLPSLHMGMDAHASVLPLAAAVLVLLQLEAGLTKPALGCDRILVPSGDEGQEGGLWRPGPQWLPCQCPPQVLGQGRAL